MITVHHLEKSQSERIVWLCEELGIPYELKRYDREQGRAAPAEYKALHWSGTAPIITDGDLTLGESGAIMDYIVGRYGDNKLTVPPDSSEFANYLFWYHYVNASFMPNLLMLMAEGNLARIGKRAYRALEVLNEQLADHKWLAGENFTIADIMMGYPLTTRRHLIPFDLSPYPNIQVYLKRVGERPAYRRAMERGDPGLPLMLN